MVSHVLFIAVKVLSVITLFVSVCGFFPRSSLVLFPRRFARQFDVLEGYKYEKAFITTLSESLSLSRDTEKKLNEQLVTPKSLPLLSMRHFEDKFNISAVDAAKLVSWSLSKQEEERCRLIEETQQERTAKKLKNTKHVQIFDGANKKFSTAFFRNDADYQTYLNRRRIPFLALVDEDGDLVDGNVFFFESLCNGSRYSMPAHELEAVEALRQDLLREDKAKAERSSNDFISDYYDKKLAYIGSDISMHGCAHTHSAKHNLTHIDSSSSKRILHLYTH